MSREKQIEEIYRPMCEETFNNLEKQYRELAKVKAESEQIEEMADLLCEAKEHDCKGGNDCLCVKQAEALYNAGYRKQSGWISVDERLPNAFVNVITCDRDNRVRMDFYCGKLNGWNRGEFITHWMPLPEAPKKKGGE